MTDVEYPPTTEERSTITRHLADEAETLAFGRLLQRAVAPGTIVFLRGNLGAGKTTLVRGYLRATGFQGPVKSPTFTVVEEYRLNGAEVLHFDLYRLGTPDELEWLGIRDYLRGDVVCFIEWPERGEDVLPMPDLDITLTISGSGRQAAIAAPSTEGREILSRIECGH